MKQSYEKTESSAGISKVTNIFLSEEIKVQIDTHRFQAM